MCLIIHQPKGHTLSHAMLRDIFSRNRDGFGVMRIEDDPPAPADAPPPEVEEPLLLPALPAEERMSMVRFFRGANDRFANRERLEPQAEARDGPRGAVTRAWLRQAAASRTGALPHRHQSSMESSRITPTRRAPELSAARTGRTGAFPSSLSRG